MFEKSDAELFELDRINNWMFSRICEDGVKTSIITDQKRTPRRLLLSKTELEYAASRLAVISDKHFEHFPVELYERFVAAKLPAPSLEVAREVVYYISLRRSGGVDPERCFSFLGRLLEGSETETYSPEDQLTTILACLHTDRPRSRSAPAPAPAPNLLPLRSLS
jgi:hypothetical protein